MVRLQIHNASRAEEMVDKYTSSLLQSVFAPQICFRRHGFVKWLSWTSLLVRVVRDLQVSVESRSGWLAKHRQG